MIRSIIVIILSLVIVTPSSAQTLAQATQLSASLEKSSLELNQVSINLYQMATDMSPPELDAVEAVTGMVVRFEAPFESLLAHVFIYSILIDSRDQSLVKRLIPNKAKQTVVVADMVIGNINRFLLRIKSNAAIAEAQKARDLIQRIRDEVHRTIPGS